MASPALSSSISASSNPFDHHQELRHAGGDAVSPVSNTSVHTADTIHSPPTATNSDSTLSRHHLEASIPEAPVEDEEKATTGLGNFEKRPASSTRLPSGHQPSLLSQGAMNARPRTPSGSGSTLPAAETSAATKPKKGGLLRKLSGFNMFHHHKDRSADSAEYKASQVDRHNYELTHPHTNTVSKPTQEMTKPPVHALSPEKPKFTMGESVSNSPAGSRHPSRTPSTDGMSINTAPRSARIPASVSPSTSHSPQMTASPQRDHEDFIPRQPTRANSTFNFFRKPEREDSLDRPPPRAASFSHGEAVPVSIPGVGTPNNGAPMAHLSRTLSKASLAGGLGWGSIHNKLPTFDSLYTYKEAHEKKLKSIGKTSQIGEGAGGIIRTARLKPGKHPAYEPSSTGGDLGLFAVKTFRKQSDKESEGWYCQKLVREFRVHCALSHANIVKLADICIEQKKFGEASFVAVLDFCVGGDLFDLHYHAWNAIDQGVMSKVERNCVFKQLMFAVNYMHQQGIAHRDIKLENMLINGHGQMKLADFGTSNFAIGADKEECRGFVGTDHSVAPEAFLSDLSTENPKPVYDGLKADIWACAVTWHILTWSNDEPTAVLRAYPFGPEGADPENKQWQRYMNVIKRYEPNRHIPGWDLYMERKAEKTSSPPPTPTVGRQDSIAFSATSGQSGRSELDQMFDISDPNPASSPPSKDDLRDPLRKCRPFANGYPGSGFTMAKGMLDPDPDHRWSAQQILEDPFFSLIECCQKDSNSRGYDSSKDRQRKGLHKVHNHIRSAARKMMEESKVEQARTDKEVVNIRRQDSVLSMKPK